VCSHAVPNSSHFTPNLIHTSPAPRAPPPVVVTRCLLRAQPRCCLAILPSFAPLSLPPFFLPPPPPRFFFAAGTSTPRTHKEGGTITHTHKHTHHHHRAPPSPPPHTARTTAAMIYLFCAVLFALMCLHLLENDWDIESLGSVFFAFFAEINELTDELEQAEGCRDHHSRNYNHVEKECALLQEKVDELKLALAVHEGVAVPSPPTGPNYNASSSATHVPSGAQAGAKWTAPLVPGAPTAPAPPTTPTISPTSLPAHYARGPLSSAVREDEYEDEDEDE